MTLLSSASWLLRPQDRTERSVGAALAHTHRSWDIAFASLTLFAILPYLQRLVVQSVCHGASHLGPTCPDSFLAAFPCNAGRLASLLHVFARLPTALGCLTAAEVCMPIQLCVCVLWILTAAFSPRYPAAVRELFFWAFLGPYHAVLLTDFALGVQPPSSYFIYNASNEWIAILFINLCLPHRFRWAAFVNTIFAAVSVALPLLDARLPPAQRTAPPGSMASALATVMSAGGVTYLAHRNETALRRRLHAANAALGGGDGGSRLKKEQPAAVAEETVRSVEESEPCGKAGSRPAGALAAGAVGSAARAAEACSTVSGGQGLECRGQAEGPASAAAQGVAPMNLAPAAAASAGDEISQSLAAAVRGAMAAPGVRSVGKLDYTSPSHRVRVFMKVPNMDPQQVPHGLVDRLAAHARAGNMHLSNVCVRAGCIELLLELTERRLLDFSVGGGSSSMCGSRSGAKSAAEALAMAGAMVDALGVPLPEGTQLRVHWGGEELHLVKGAQGWEAAAAAAVAALTAALPLPQADAATVDAVTATLDAHPHLPAAAPPPPLACLHSVRPLFLVAPDVVSEGVSGRAALSLQCRMGRPPLAGETLVVSQYGRCLRHQPVNADDGSTSSSSGGSSSSNGGSGAVLLEVSDCDLSQAGLIRVEVRGAGGGAGGGSARVLILPWDAALLREVGELDADLDALEGAHSSRCGTEDAATAQAALQDLICDLGTWFEFVAAATASPPAIPSGIVGGGDGGGGGGGSGGSVLDVASELHALAEAQGHRQMMADTAQALLGYAAQRGWHHTTARLLQGVRAAGLVLPSDLAAPSPQPSSTTMSSLGDVVAPADACGCKEAAGGRMGGGGGVAAGACAFEEESEEEEGEEGFEWHARRHGETAIALLSRGHALAWAPLCACVLAAATYEVYACCCAVLPSGFSLGRVPLAALSSWMG